MLTNDKDRMSIPREPRVRSVSITSAVYETPLKRNKYSVESTLYDDALSTSEVSTPFRKAIVGTIVHCLTFGEVEIIEDGAIIYSSDTGVILQVVDLSQGVGRSVLEDCDEVEDHTGKLILPGFIDAHVHAPQYVFTGTGMDLPLLEWLEKYTFPCEARFADCDYAKSVLRHLKHGTTFASYFATIHLEGTKALCEVLSQVGQRAFVGKVCMDRNAPDFYCEETAMSAADTEAFVRHVLQMTVPGQRLLDSVDGQGKGQGSSAAQEEDIHVSSSGSGSQSSDEENDSGSDGPVLGKRSFLLAALHTVSASVETAAHVTPNTVNTKPAVNTPRTLLNTIDCPRVLPCVTPRFVPTCSSDNMAALGSIAARYGLPVQSHLSESVNEIAWVQSLHPDAPSYAQVYEQHGLLTGHAFLAHCVHSDDTERDCLRRTHTGVVHCASSNFSLCSGICDVRAFLAEGIAVGLGTDVAGGYSPSMLDAIRQTVTASRALSFVKNAATPSAPSTPSGDKYRPISAIEALYLATMGGARVLNMDNVVGNFLSHKKLDCLVIDLHAENSPLDLFDDDHTVSTLDKVEKFLFLGDDRNIAKVIVDGHSVL